MTQPKHPSTIANGIEGTQVGGSHIVGDVDGDGFDDIIVEAVAWTSDLGHVPASQTFLSYGRPEFPEQISLVDADASFATHAFGPAPLGDINGDGLADFAVMHQPLAYEILLGSRSRFEGAHAAGTSGHVWVDPIVPELGVPLALTLEAAGDLNCDGVDDLLVYATRFAAEDDLERNEGGTTAENVYIVLGGKKLPEGDWDPKWAVARFGETASERQIFGGLVLSSFGDSDADGCDDLIAYGDDTLAVFYGGKSRFSGRFGLRDADARLNSPGWPQRLRDLDDDGADEIVFSIVGRSEIQVKYGSPKRWSGERALNPELRVSLESNQPPGQIAIDSGDIDLDGAPELLLGTGVSAARSDDNSPTSRGVVFALRGTGERVTGVRTLTDSDIFFLSPEVKASEAPGSEMFFLPAERQPNLELTSCATNAYEYAGSRGRDLS